VPTADHFYQLPAEQQVILMTYELIREAEEAELASLRIR